MLFSSGLASALLLVGAASAKVAHVLIPDHAGSQTVPRTISPSDARLVFARRLGLSDFHSLRNANEATIEALNVLGGRPQPLFSGESQTETSGKAIIVVEGAEDLFGRKHSKASGIVSDLL